MNLLQIIVSDDFKNIFVELWLQKKIVLLLYLTVEITTEKEPEPNLITPKPTNSSVSSFYIIYKMKIR